MVNIGGCKMDYLYSNIDELNQVDNIVLHCDDSYFPSRYLSAQYIKDLLSREPVTAGDYQDVVKQLLGLVKVNIDYHDFNRVSQLTQVLFSTYQQDGTTLHLFPDLLLSRSAYETIRERLDEIAFSN